VLHACLLASRAGAVVIALLKGVGAVFAGQSSKNNVLLTMQYLLCYGARLC
jgi:hypothetical protein